jgi:hypothetical protein
LIAYGPSGSMYEASQCGLAEYEARIWVVYYSSFQNSTISVS